MARLLNAIAAGILLLGCAGCSGGRSSDAGAPSTVAAIPDSPHVDGPIPVRLQPALTLPASAPCEPIPEQRIFCSPGATRTFKALSDGLSATIAGVGTAPSSDHTSWTTTVLFDEKSTAAVKQIARQTGGLGGLVLVVDGPRVLGVIDPADFGPGKAQSFGLEKPEAWELVEAFRP